MNLMVLFSLLLPVAIQGKCYQASCQFNSCPEGQECHRKTICHPGTGCYLQSVCCDKADRCDKPVNYQLCGQKQLRYYYDKATNGCHQFYDGGCDGTGNSFKTLKECGDVCHTTGTTNPTSTATCQLPKDSGPCYAYYQRFFFNKDTGMCEEFAYGGCLGNANRFTTMAECKSACSTNKCQLPMQKGPCRGYLPRYYFDKATGSCQQFFYGGCQGNANNFMSMDECAKACPATAKPVCKLPKQPGVCLAYFRRYFFDQAAGTCQQFIYGGCQANGNNFDTLAECNTACPDTKPVTKAVCYMVKDKTSYQQVYGNLTLLQATSSSPLHVTFNLLGLTSDTGYGIHIHTYSQAGNDCSASGPYYNPQGANQGTPGDSERHVGDLGTINAFEGKIQVTVTDPQASIIGEKNNVIGRSIVLTDTRNDYVQGRDAGSPTNGNAGRPLACCVIGRAK